MCSGKTTIGRILANRLTKNHYDTDELLIKSLKIPPEKIIKELSRYEFQLIENEIIRKIHTLTDIIISLGSGSIAHENSNLCKDNISKLKLNGILINLIAPSQNLYKRYLQDINIPNLRRQSTNMLKSIEDRILKREHIHTAICDFTIDTSSLLPEQVVDKILNLI